ncbi:MAG: methionyl-tRNA formyltransferase [Oscillospiraceae bacterium]|jgi:methionyl-tRNA formyltransferase|nr:methionyl-tRNA formyltransferase [Oscillospiraceae bacterium]
MNIVFMGTPDFAVPCLARLAGDGHHVRGVFCQPDKPKGRGYTLAPPPVKEYALAHGPAVYQPSTLRGGEALSILQELRPELIVVVAYGKILPREILELPPQGCINIHASLLPKLRGAAPIQRVILNGGKQTGVTAMQMDIGMDTGDILLSRAIDIGENETAGELFGRLSTLGAQLLAETLSALKNGALLRTPQDDTQATLAPMLSRADSPIDWTRPSWELHNQVRGLNPWPCATAEILGVPVKILQTRIAEAPPTDTAAIPGTVLESRKRLIVVCGGGTALEVLTLQPGGKKAMPAAAFLAGRR